MRRIVIGAALAGVGLLILRGLRPKLQERFRAAFGRMFEQMPDDSPPKRMIQSIEEIRRQTGRILELLEEGEQATGAPEQLSPASVDDQSGGHLNEVR
jgi:hypothetical protein